MSALSVLQFWALVPLFLAFAASRVSAQDTLVTIQGDFMAVKLLEINDQTIRYKSRQSASDSSIHLRQVFMIKYATGAKDIFQEHLIHINHASLPAPQTAITVAELQAKGKSDAQRHFSYKKRELAVGAITLLNPAAGLVVTLATNAAPAPTFATSQNPKLLSDKEYVAAYQAEGKKIKKRKAWSGFLGGVGAYILLLGMVATDE